MKEQSRSVPAVPKQKSEGIIKEIKKSAVAIEKHTCIDFLPVIILQVKLMAVDWLFTLVKAAAMSAFLTRFYGKGRWVFV